MIQVSNSSLYLNFLVTKFLINSKTFLLTVHPNPNYYIFSWRLFHSYLIRLFYEKDYNIKILMFVTGGIIGLFLYLQFQGIITVNMQKLADASTFLLSVVSSSFDQITQLDTTTSLGIPLTTSLTAGFTVAFIKSWLPNQYQYYYQKTAAKRGDLFLQTLKVKVIHNQNGKCAYCRHSVSKLSRKFHHKDGNRSNNKISNCQLLCSNCHSKITSEKNA